MPDGDGRQPPGGSGQAVPPPGEGVADGGGSDSFFVNDARDRVGARAAGGEDQRDTMRELVDLFKQAFATSTHDQGHRAHSGSSNNQILELRQREKINVPVWSDEYLKNTSIEVALRVFTSAFEAWLESEGLAGVMRSSEVPVGAAGVDLNWLSSTFGEERVKQSRKIWTFMLAKITAQPVQAQILASEPPQAGYRVFLEQYSQEKSHERQTLDDAWNLIGQRQGESLKDYYGRAVALWMRLRSYGDNRDEKSMCKHIVRGFLPRFDKTKDRLLFDSMLSRATMQEMLRLEEHELRYERRAGEGKEEMRHALVAAGVGRGGEAGKPAAAGSEQGGHRLQQPQRSVQPHQQQPSHFCQLHGPNSTHETSECHKLRNEILAHYNEFCAYMSGRREAQALVFPRGGAQDSGRMVGDPYRQQPYQNEQGAGWSRGHSPALPGPPRGQGSGTGGQLQGRNSGGRGYGGYASLAVWACVVPDAAMGHAVLLGRDSWMRFNSRTFTTLPQPGPDGRDMGELTLSPRFTAGACGYATHDDAPASLFHLKYAGSSGISLGPEPALVEVDLVRSSGMPALIGEYLVSFKPEVGALSSPDAFVSNGLQGIPLAGCAELEPGDVIGVSAAPLLRVSVENLKATPCSIPTGPPTSTSPPRVDAVGPKSGTHRSPDPASAPPPPKPPPQELLDRFSEAQSSGFMRLWARLPAHMHDIAFDLHNPGWTPEAIDRLADALVEYSDVFSTSKTDFGSCTIMPFTLSFPAGTKPVASRPYRINPLMQKNVDAVLDQYLAAGLIQHSTSPWASPLVAIPKKDGSVRITVNYKRLKALVDLDGQPLPRVDGILDSLYTGKVFSIFDLNSAFHQIVCDEDTVPLTAFCTPTQLFEWLRMPQGANASPSWFVKVINRVVHGLERVLAYLDDVICFDEEPLGHVLNLIEFFKRLRQYNLKLSAGKARVGATHANFLGHTISPAGVSPDGVKVRALTHMPPPTNVKQLRSLLGGLSYYRKFLKNLATKVRPLNSLLKQGVPFKYTPGMVMVVKTLLSELARPPILVFPDWAAIEDNSRPFRLCSDACIDGFGASLEQEQLNGSVRPIVYISRATLPAERNWTVLDLEAGGIVWAIKRLRGYLWLTKFIIYSDHKALESIGKVGEHNARVQRWLEFLSNFTYTLKYRKGSANGNADNISRLPVPAQDTDKTGLDCIDGVDQAGVFLIWACGRNYHSSSTPEVGLGGLRPP
ncbi:unnamed protein product [Ectocarpus sp. CCAP 1310/34]|nr:unnamed protein product [Ectocarpus sp. CCAP 1310/34]